MLVTHKKTRKIGSWDLSDLVPDPNSKEFQKFIKSIEQKVAHIENKRRSLRYDIPVSDFQSIFYVLEDISEKISVAVGYAHLKYSADTSSNVAASLLTKMDLIAADIANRVLFFDLWFRKELDEENAWRLIESMPKVYREYFRHKRLLAKYVLTEPEEKIISTLEVTGTNALTKIYDRMSNGFDYVMRAKKAQKVIKRRFSNKEKLLSLIRSTKPEERKGAYQSLLHVYKKNSGVLGEIYQNLVIQWRDENLSMRGYESPITVAQAPLPLAETASVFAEMLLNDRLISKVGLREQKILLAEQIDDMYATIMRQAYFTLFEIDAHQIIANQNSTIDEVSELYFNNLHRQFGDSVNVSSDFKWEWTYIPYFYHSPFYCYAYSFGNLLVLSLYRQFKNEGASFVPEYFKSCPQEDQENLKNY